MVEHISTYEVGAVPESLFHNGCNAYGNSNIGEAYAAPESGAADSLNVLADGNINEAGAVPEGKTCDGLYTGAHDYALKLFAAANAISPIV